MNEEVMVSIRCLCYNHARYLREALDGMLKQKTSFKYEIIIHDDASTDGSQEIIKEYENKYPEIIKPIYQQENQYSQGVSIYRTYMASIMRGKYIAICECDDCWTDPLKLQKQIDFLETHPDYSCCCHGFRCIREDNSIIRIVKRKELESHDISIEDVIMNKGIPQLATLVYRTDLIENRPDFFTQCSVGDYPLFLYLSTEGKIFYINEIMSNYRIHDDGSWVSKAQKKPEVFKRHVDLLKTMLDQFDSYTSFKYTETVALRKSNCEFQFLKISNNINGLLKNNYFKSLNPIKKVKTFLSFLLHMQNRR